MGHGEVVGVHAMLILSLCDYSGSWSKPYLDAGYEVVMVDVAHQEGVHQVSNRLWKIGADLTKWRNPFRPWAVLAAPPCTCFCRPGARHWFKMDFTRQTDGDVAIFRACWSICQSALGWWALENPPGRHRECMPEIPEKSWQFQPWEYGDPWAKQTYIWGSARKPIVMAPVEPQKTVRTPNGRTQGRIARMSSSHKREREKTPEGFARAFFEANP